MPTNSQINLFLKFHEKKKRVLRNELSKKFFFLELRELVFLTNYIVGYVTQYVSAIKRANLPFRK